MGEFWEPAQKGPFRLQEDGYRTRLFLRAVTQGRLLTRRGFEPALPFSAACIPPLALLFEILTELDQLISAHVLQMLFSRHGFTH
jgi:hypothetical protein